MKKISLTLIAILLLIQFSHAQWTTSGSNIYNSNTGNVGIGTTNPVYRLLVNTGTDQNLQVRPVGTSGIFLNAANDANTASVPMQFGASSFNFIIGNVGIGTTSPAAKLDVRAPFTGVTQAAYIEEGEYNQVTLQIKNTNSSAISPLFQADNSARTVFLVTPGGNVGIGTTSPGTQLDIQGSGTNALPLYFRAGTNLGTSG